MSRKFDLEESKTFCMLPWTAQNFRINSGVYPCCVATDDGNMGNLADNSPREIWNSDKMKQLRHNMMNNIPSKACEPCYWQEKRMGHSMRSGHTEHNHDKYDKLVHLTEPDGYLPAYEITYIDFRLSNVCNLKCRQCGHWASSAWFRDDIARDTNHPPTKQVIRVIEDRPEIWEEIKELLDTVESIYFAGGEPLMMVEHYNALKYLISTNRAKAVDLFYNTNLTQRYFKGNDIFELWNNFDDVKIQASLDGSYERGEYIRKGIVWDNIVTNRKALLEICPDIHFEVSATISAMNIIHIPDFYDEWITEGYVEPENVRFNLITGLDCMMIFNLTPALKEQAKEKLEKYKNNYNSKPLYDLYQNMIELLDSEQFDLLEEFRKETDFLDKLRGESLLTTFPELKEMYDK